MLYAMRIKYTRNKLVHEVILYGYSYAKIYRINLPLVLLGRVLNKTRTNLLVNYFSINIIFPHHVGNVFE